MQTILGSGGVIGNGLARELTAYTNHIRLVARHSPPVDEGNEFFSGDLTDAEGIIAAYALNTVARRKGESVGFHLGRAGGARRRERHPPQRLESIPFRALCG